MAEIKTNAEIFKRVFDRFVLAPGILREALTHYLTELEKSEPWENGFISFERWLEETKQVKEMIDNLYSQIH